MNKSSITKYIVGAVIVVAFAAYIIFANKNSMPTSVATTETSTTPVTSGTASSTASSTAAGTPTSTGSGTTTVGQYKDGTYTGTVADAFYGNLQVAAVINGGQITDIQFLQMPSGGNSSVVTAMAEPALKQETLTAQSANVNTVSGATQDSEAFNQSLSAALAQAK